MSLLFDRLNEIMRTLRSEEGCPWDREQTHESLIKYLREESHEFFDAVYAGNSSSMCEELGDVLLQVVFHAEIARSDGNFTIDDVIHSICEKLIRRHPHVFGTASATNSEEVIKNWQQIKIEEKGAKPESSLDGVPKSLPALSFADELQRKAAKVGFDWPDWKGAWAKAEEETAEFLDALKHESKERQIEEFGDLLFSLVNTGRKLSIDSEEALRLASVKFTNRFKKTEIEAGPEFKNMNLEEKESIWKRMKEV
jgi:MazG family protein